MANKDSKETKNSEIEESSTTEKVAEALKKIITSGSATEVSKEIIGTVFGQALKAKDDITLRVSNEMISLVRKIDFVKEFSKFAENHKFRINAEIEIIRKENDQK